MKNNTNDSSKRNALQVQKILSFNNLDLKVWNTGNGRTFEVNDCSVKTRFTIKKAGFILERSTQGQKYCRFSAF